MTSEFEKAFPKISHDLPDLGTIANMECARILRQEGALWALKWVYKADCTSYAIMLQALQREIKQLEKEQK